MIDIAENNLYSFIENENHFFQVYIKIFLNTGTSH
jgi:hypothetical protein